MQFIPEIGIGTTSMSIFLQRNKYDLDLGENIHVGVGYYVQFSKKVQFYTGLYYDNNIAGISVGADSVYQNDLRFKSLALPLGFMISQPLGRNKMLFLGISTQYNFILRGQNIESFYYKDKLLSKDKVNYVLGKDIINTESSLLLKVGFKFSKHWGIYTNFNLGITNINKNLEIMGPNAALRMIRSNFGVNYYIYRN